MAVENSTSDTPSHHNDFATLAVHGGSPIDPISGAVIPPIILSTTFAHSVPGKPFGSHMYSRASNPNRNNFEEAIARLENAQFAVAFGSGSTAVATILLTLEKGSHVVSVADLYGGTKEYFTDVAATHGINISFTNDLDKELEHLIQPGITKLVWIETPSNPTLKVVDISKAARIAHQHGIQIVVDNTFLSPYIQTPLDFGADLVVHSVTKYINGHADVLMGVVCMNSDEMHKKLKYLQLMFGAVPSPFDCWLASRGLKTLHLRVREASKNALAIARMLQKSDSIIVVHYPGLESHESRDIVLKQHRDGMGGGVLSFRIKGGGSAAVKFCQSTKLFVLAVSLGGVESLVELPTSMTHARIPDQAREEVDVYDDLIRMSCGVEASIDLEWDIQQALKQALSN